MRSAGGKKKATAERYCHAVPNYSKVTVYMEHLFPTFLLYVVLFILAYFAPIKLKCRKLVCFGALIWLVGASERCLHQNLIVFRLACVKLCAFNLLSVIF